MRSAASGCSRRRIATLVSGPVAMTVTRSPARRARRPSAPSRSADPAETRAPEAEGLRARSPRGSTPRCWSSRDSGPSAPAATGTSATPATLRAIRAFRLVWTSGTLPPTVVTARRSMAGCPAASQSPKTSSWPGSQSTMTGMPVARGVVMAGHPLGSTAGIRLGPPVLGMLPRDGAALQQRLDPEGHRRDGRDARPGGEPLRG